RCFLQHLPVIEKDAYTRRFRRGPLQLLHINIACGDQLDTRTTQRLARDNAAAISITDHADADALVSAENRARHGCETADACGYLTEKCAAGIHEVLRKPITGSVALRPVSRSATAPPLCQARFGVCEALPYFRYRILGSVIFVFDIRRNRILFLLNELEHGLDRRITFAPRDIRPFVLFPIL